MTDDIIKAIRHIESRNCIKNFSKEKLIQWCQKYWSNPDLITPTHEDNKTPYYEEEPYIQNFSED